MRAIRVARLVATLVVGGGVVPLRTLAQGAPAAAPVVVEDGRFTVEADARDARLARAVLRAAVANDAFPGLPPPHARVRIRIAPDAERFRDWIGPGVPEWGAAVAFPGEQLVVMQGGRAGSGAGDPLVVLRHELAHLALHEALGDRVPRWFDEGYASVAAGEWGREQAFETSLALVWRGLPGVDSLDAGFLGGGTQATWHYALAHRAVAELLAIDGERGLGNLVRYWASGASFEQALRRAYGMTAQAFDDHWHRRTRQRYGALALVTNVSLAVGGFSLLLGPLVVARRRRDRARLEAMRAHEAAQERAARDSALDALLADPPADRLTGPSARP
jgi:hypothetical protein